ncbi:MAG TPA: leucine dehydrogenase, partial [Alphaproteobacteria bacterium]|nr:leucine dehydrogenase [Alphaproteobacteria bacterium]
VLNDDTIPRLRAKAVAGSANNQLAEDCHGEMLRQRGILYAPDYVINAGGIINISYEGPDYDRQAAFDHCAGIDRTLTDIFRLAEHSELATNLVADQLAEQRLAEAREARPAQPLRRTA